MKSIYRFLAAELVLMLLCTSALAASDSKLQLAVGTENGILYAWMRTSDNKLADLNFTAKTENGELKVEEVTLVQDKGTVWFVVLDYDSDCRWSVDAVTRTERNVLEQVAQQIVKDNDMGALVTTASEPQIVIQDAAQFRNELKRKPNDSNNTDQLGYTLRRVLEYIVENESEFAPRNVGVIVVTSALIEDEMATGNNENSFKTLLQDEKFNRFATHVICTAAPESTDSGRDAWRARAEMMVSYAEGTLGGSGMVTKKLDTEKNKGGSSEAVGVVSKALQETVVLALNPQSISNVGMLLTITQTTAAGKIREQTWDIGDTNSYKVWYEFWNKPGPVPTYVPSSVTGTSSLLFVGSSSVTAVEKKEGIPTELIVGIAVGVVVLILAIVLILVRRGAKKQPEQTPVAYSAPAKPRDTVVVLQDASGHKLTGTMKNGKLTIGRDTAKGAMLIIPNDGKLSGLHATIAKNGQGMTITDNHSTNGTKVNGAPITGVVPLNQNDSVTVGSTTYKVTWHA